MPTEAATASTDAISPLIHHSEFDQDLSEISKKCLCLQEFPILAILRKLISIKTQQKHRHILIRRLKPISLQSRLLVEAK